MDLDKRIAAQMKRVTALQKEVFGRKPGAADAAGPERVKRERAVALRDTIAALDARKKRCIERFDAEIAELQTELEGLERSAGVDGLVRARSGAAYSPKSRKAK